MAVAKEQVEEVLKQVIDPELNRDIVSLGMVKEVGVQDNGVFVHLEITSPNSKVSEIIKASASSKITELGAGNVQIQISTPARQSAGAPPKQALPGIRHVVAVASGKGGVGKTTTTVNLALALAKKGFKVGLMDGDIYGPNVPIMLGIPNETRPRVNDEDKMIPIESYGVKSISMGVLVPADQPMVWRGPMLHGAVTQFLQKVDWGELDFLLIDLPPGTGDVQLSLVQNVALSGSVIVTTPQEVALLDVRKGVAMFGKTKVPVLGVIENMAGEIFGSGGGEKAAGEFGVPFMGSVPLMANVRQGGDEGKPIVEADPNSEAAQAFIKSADALVESLSLQQTV